MVTLTIDRRLYTVGPSITIGDLYKRAGLDPSTHALRIEMPASFGTPPVLEELERPLHFTGKRGCPYRVFVSAPR